MKTLDSREQYRDVFAQHEPQILKVLDGFLAEFGRDQIKNLKVYCPVLVAMPWRKGFGEAVNSPRTSRNVR